MRKGVNSSRIDTVTVISHSVHIYEIGELFTR